MDSVPNKNEAESVMTMCSTLFAVCNNIFEMHCKILGTCSNAFAIRSDEFAQATKKNTPRRKCKADIDAADREGFEETHTLFAASYRIFVECQTVFGAAYKSFVTCYKKSGESIKSLGTCDDTLVACNAAIGSCYKAFEAFNSVFDDQRE